jgi:hypothetical protein
MNYSISFSTDKLSIVVPRRFSPFLFAFIPLWVAGWITLTVKGSRNGQPESAIGLCIFGFVTVVFTYAWLWNLGGKEELNFTMSSLTYRRVLFGISRTREFWMDRIAEPHFVESKAGGKSHTPSGLGFYYSGKEVRVGDHLTQRDAKEIVGALIRRFPELPKCWGRYAEGLPELNEDMTLNLK